MLINELSTFILALVAAAAAGLVGSFALMKRVILAGDVMSHIALPGLGLAFLLNINPLLGGAVTLLLGIILIWKAEQRTGLTTDTMIGVLFAASVAVGALITPEGDLIDALFGGFKTLGSTELIVGACIVTALLAAILLLRNKLILNLFSPELASSAGLNVNRLNFAFLLIFAAAILLGLKLLGALLVGALIIIPAAIGRQIATSFTPFLILSAFAGTLSVAIGFALAAAYHVALGPVIVTAAAALFAISLLKRKK